jgi:hypothetical protein
MHYIAWEFLYGSEYECRGGGRCGLECGTRISCNPGECLSSVPYSALLDSTTIRPGRGRCSRWQNPVSQPFVSRLREKGSWVNVDIEPIREFKVRRDLSSQTASTVTLLATTGLGFMAAKLRCDDVRAALNASGVLDQNIQSMIACEENESLLSVIASRLFNRGQYRRRPDQITVIEIPLTELALWMNQFSLRLPSVRPYFAKPY